MNGVAPTYEEAVQACRRWGHRLTPWLTPKGLFQLCIGCGLTWAKDEQPDGPQPVLSAVSDRCCSHPTGGPV